MLIRIWHQCLVHFLPVDSIPELAATLATSSALVRALWNNLSSSSVLGCGVSIFHLLRTYITYGHVSDIIRNIITPNNWSIRYMSWSKGRDRLSHFTSVSRASYLTLMVGIRNNTSTCQFNSFYMAISCFALRKHLFIFFLHCTFHWLFVKYLISDRVLIISPL